MAFPVVTYGCESWTIKKAELKNWCFFSLNVVLEKTLESPLDCKEIQSVHPKRNQSLIFIGRTDAETPLLWLPDAKNWVIWKDPDAGKDWRQEEKETTENEMVGWVTDSKDVSLRKFWELLMDREDWRAAVHGVTRIWTERLNWIEKRYFQKVTITWRTVF